MLRAAPDSDDEDEKSSPSIPSEDPSPSPNAPAGPDPAPSPTPTVPDADVDSPEDPCCEGGPMVAHSDDPAPVANENSNQLVAISDEETARDPKWPDWYDPMIEDSQLRPEQMNRSPTPSPPGPEPPRGPTFYKLFVGIMVSVLSYHVLSCFPHCCLEVAAFLLC